MRAKCNCNNCSAHLEFDTLNEGTVIACPQCGIETRLYIPGNNSTPKAAPKLNKNARLKLIILGAGAVMLAGIVALLVLNWDRIFRPLAQSLGGTAAIIFSLVVGILVLIWAILWIIFPVFVYYQLNEMIKVLRLIERNTRK